MNIEKIKDKRKELFKKEKLSEYDRKEALKTGDERIILLAKVCRGDVANYAVKAAGKKIKLEKLLLESNLITRIKREKEIAQEDLRKVIEENM